MANWSTSIPALLHDLDVGAQTATRRGAERIVQTAKERSRVRTGTMRDGWQYERTGPYEYTIFNPVDWTVYNEYGTRYMSAQPMLGPAVEAEAARDAVAKDLQRVFEQNRQVR